ncbi:multicopper oxidase family protein [Aliamphritea hakodatensis]|uniref:multicopper oxidase family protein n=1 Tax=Aliamphritea hakodatensis TaxID=2895352 RepID=UPI0022FD44EF|nr:multicopper oxidase family protein [Aliamphritea hakodatensis]
MDVKRRAFLRLAGTGICALPLNISGLVYASQEAAAKVQKKLITLQPEQAYWFSQSPPTDLWAMGQNVLRLQQHIPAEITVRNRLPDASSVHWHGMRVPNDMDGASGLTQQAIDPGQAFTYRFTPPDAGTYWAHSHHNTYEQLARGLCQPLVVEESTPYPADHDHLLVLDDWRLNSTGQLDLESLGSMHEWSHGGRMGNLLTVNREITPRLPVEAGSRTRLRILNTANSRIMALELNGLQCWIIAKDGQPLTKPLKTNESLTIAPAERYDLTVDIPTDWQGEQPIHETGSRTRLAGAFWQIIPGSKQRTERQSPQPLPANPVPVPGEGKPDHHAQLLMTGGAMGGLRSAIYRNTPMSAQKLSVNKQAWAFNGVANLPDKPLLSARTGATVEIEIVNDTRWPHGMHLHGHHFQLRGSDRYEPGMLHDTALMERNENLTIRFKAGLPGKWLLHCHMIEHQAAGMVTWIEVTA